MRGELLSFVTVLLLGAGQAAGQDQDSTVYTPGNGVSMPIAIRSVPAMYTSDAMRAKIQGAVVVEAVVLSDGSVGNVKVVQSLDTEYGLDKQAVESARQWAFKPGTKDGETVAVRVQIKFAFTLGLKNSKKPTTRAAVSTAGPLQDSATSALAAVQPASTTSTSGHGMMWGGLAVIGIGVTMAAVAAHSMQAPCAGAVIPGCERNGGLYVGGLAVTATGSVLLIKGARHHAIIQYGPGSVAVTSRENRK